MNGKHTHEGRHDHGGAHDHARAHGHTHDHTHGHTHDHTHGHTHGALGSHTRDADRRTLYLVLVLAGTFMFVEFAGGILANSLALLADAAHMLTDVAAIALALLALRFASRPATARKTYGYYRMEILAALINGAVLMILCFFIIREAWERFREPVEVGGGVMLVVATMGLTVNVIMAFLLHRSAGESLNLRGAYLHVLGDLLASVGTITAAVVVLTTGWMPADPLISVIVAFLILISSYKLVKESVDVLLEAVPAHMDLGEVRRAIEELPAVELVHDLHVWTVTSGYFAMSGHAIVADLGQSQVVLRQIHDLMHERFGIRHVTVQIEERTRYQIGVDGFGGSDDAEDQR
jgi:cobalt-zinc-cadmium efflux system protein